MTTTTTLKLTPGVHPELSPSAYHALKFDFENPAAGPISLSLLKRYADLGPIQFRYGPPFESTPAMAWGSLVDALLFTPDDLGDVVVNDQFDNFRTKAAREWRDQQIADGKTIVDKDTYFEAGIAANRLLEHPATAEILEGAANQVALISETAGIPVKCLLDIVPEHLDHDDALVDLKTTSANLYNDDALARQAGSLRYHWQAAFYLNVWNQLHPKDQRRNWRIIWQSTAPPYEVRVTQLDDLWLDAGRAAVLFHLPRLVRDIKTNSWRSPWAKRLTTLLPHNPTIWSEEHMQETLFES